MEVRNLILWLEDQKIRHYKIEEREGLRCVDSPDWPQAFKKYLCDLASPVQSSDLAEHLEWLLSLSVRVEYADNGVYESAKLTEAAFQIERGFCRLFRSLGDGSVNCLVLLHVLEQFFCPSHVTLKGDPASNYSK